MWCRELHTYLLTTGIFHFPSLSDSQVPRTLWNASRRTHTLNHCYFKAAKLYTDMAEADEKLSEAVEV